MNWSQCRVMGPLNLINAPRKCEQTFSRDEHMYRGISREVHQIMVGFLNLHGMKGNVIVLQLGSQCCNKMMALRPQSPILNASGKTSELGRRSPAWNPSTSDPALQKLCKPAMSPTYMVLVIFPRAKDSNTRNSSPPQVRQSNSVHILHAFG